MTEKVVLCLSMRETPDGPDLRTVKFLVSREDYDHLEFPVPPVDRLDDAAAKRWIDDEAAQRIFLDRVERRKEALARIEPVLLIALLGLYPKRD